MRFKADGPAIPDVLLDERDAGNVVFLCGAGVSIPAGMPSFLELAEQVTDELQAPQGSKIRKALETHRIDEESAPTGWRRRSLDELFQMLYDEYGSEQVVRIVWKRLNESPKTQRYHSIIARLSANANGHPQIVTTNFDHLFETAVGTAPRYEAPVFPDLRRSPTGITYLHGRRAESESDPHNYILSSADLGRAYLAEGWAAKFVRDLLRQHTVVLLGYQAEDPPLRYLLQGLDSVDMPSRGRLFAFDKGTDEAVRAKWSGRGVRAIPYPCGDNHKALWDTLEAWAKRADNPALWRSGVVEMSGKGPRALVPHERGMVAHVVKTAVGAKEFADADPAPPAEWLCVFDASCRYATPKSGIGSSLPPSDPIQQPFDPLETYGLDGDPPRPSESGGGGSSQREDLISWRTGDESADRWQGLSRRRGLQPAPLPPRLFHLARWLASRVHDPVLAWWVARQPALHPQLHQMLKNMVDNSSLTDGVRRGWMMVFEALERRAHHPVAVSLYRLSMRIQKHGWTADLIGEFEVLTEPVLEAGPPHTLREPQPPSGNWSDVKWLTVAAIRIRFPPQTVSWPVVPDDSLPSVYSAIERNLLRTCARAREAIEIGWDGADRGPVSRDRNAYVSLFLDILDRLARRDASRVKQHIALWPDPDPHFFDRIRLRVWSNSSLFSGSDVADHVLALSGTQFWRETDRGDLLSLLSGRWDDLPAEGRRLIGQRILKGPPRADDEDETRGQTLAASRFGWLIQNNCGLPDDLVAQWETLKGKVPGWDDGWVDDAVPTALGVQDVETDEDASVLNAVPIRDIVRVALEHSGWTSPDGPREPFKGLVKTRSGRAIRALGAAARLGEFPDQLWSTAVRHWPENAPPRATRVLHGHLLRLPARTIRAMSSTVGEWLEKRFPDVAAENGILGFELFDHLTKPFLADGTEGLQGHRAETTDAGPGEGSRPTVARAIKAPCGKAIEGLVAVLGRDKPEERAGLPAYFTSRVESLTSASGAGADDAVCVLSSRTAWLHWIDPDWVDANMIPWFRPDNDRFEPAWNGILWNWKAIRPLFHEIRDGFVALPNRMHEWDWQRETKQFCEQIVLLTLPDGHSLSFEDARRCLRHKRIKSEDREHVIWFLERVGAENDDRWRSLVIPFISNAWPKERRYRNSGTSGAWLSLLCNTGDAFPDVLNAVRDHLGAVDWRHVMFGNSIDTLAGQFPRQTLDLLDRVAPDGVGEPPYELARVLGFLADAAPELVADTRYRRLHRLAAQQ